MALQYVMNQTPLICLEAVKQNGYALRYVKEQTKEICLAAVKQTGYALKYVKEQTPEICLAAVQRIGWVLEYVKEPTDVICLAAVQQRGSAIIYVKNQTPEICLAAIKNCDIANIHIELFARNRLAAHMITDICIALYSLRLPSYILLEIIDKLLYKNDLTELMKINRIIRVNENKRLLKCALLRSRMQSSR
jgi:hypothetical protein